MKAHRFFIKPEENNLQFGQKTIIDDQAIVHQWRHVLHLQHLEKIILLDNTGYEFEAEITAMSEKAATIRILAKKKNENEPKQTVVLYQAMPKKAELFEMILQKGTEVGVKKFVPLITARTERKSFPKRERLQRIIKEAAEQAERGIIPELTEPIKIDVALHSVRKYESGEIISYLFDPSGEKLSDEKNAVLRLKGRELAVFIGPEGGFTDEELTAAKKAGISVISLGPRILRTETAGIVIPALFLIS